MKKYVYVCDKCKKENIDKNAGLPKEWRSIRIQVTFTEYEYYETVLCPKCVVSLGMEKREQVSVQRENIRDRLYSIIEEIVKETAQG